MSVDAIVVGAGIVGAAVGEALAADGLAVTVLDAEFPGAGTTSAAMGHVVVMDDSEAQFALTGYSRRLWSERAAELPPDVEDECPGTLWVASDEEELEHAVRRSHFYRERGVEAEVLDSAALEKAEPNLRRGLAGALLVHGDRVIYPPNAARRLLSNAVVRGALAERRVRVEAIEPGRVRVNGSWRETAIVVNAAGVGAPELTPGLAIEPRKGHLVISDRYPGFCRHQLVELGYLKSAHSAGAESVAFNLQPRATGQVLVGSSREFVGLDRSTNRRLVGRMVRRAVDFVPALAALSVLRTWVGFRPSTPDNLPFIGEVDEGVFVAAGHEGLGITTALGTARLLADLVAGRVPEIDPSPYSPLRPMPEAQHG